jgi:hypothetical protein
MESEAVVWCSVRSEFCTTHVQLQHVKATTAHTHGTANSVGVAKAGSRGCTGVHTAVSENDRPPGPWLNHGVAGAHGGCCRSTKWMWPE